MSAEKNGDSEVGLAAGKLAKELGFGRILGESGPIVTAIDRARRYAGSDSPVLIMGETGTGKELCARAIHYCSRRSAHPFVAVNCSAVPCDLFENEFFGSVTGAFTGARSHAGLFEQADGGTLFLNEVNSLAITSQPKLLRTLESREVRRLGDTLSRSVDVRIISAANCNLRDEAEAGRFRLDLFYRLHILTVRMPPLRERREDIPLLANHYLKHLISALEASNNATGDGLHGSARADAGDYPTRGSPSPQPSPLRRGFSPGRSGASHLCGVPAGFSPAAIAKLMSFDWPGNVRELQNVVEKAVALAAGSAIEPQDIDLSSPPSRPAGETLLQQKNRMVYDFTHQRLLEILAEHRWNYTESAKACGSDRRTFYALVVKHGLKRSQPEQHPCL